MPPPAEAFFLAEGSSGRDQPVWGPRDEVMATCFRNHLPSRKKPLPEILDKAVGFKVERRSASSPNLVAEWGSAREEKPAASLP